MRCALHSDPGLRCGLDLQHEQRSLHPGHGHGGTAGTGNSGGNGCQSVTITPTRSIPNIMFLVDQSGSMPADFGGGLNRWEAAHAAITEIVAETDSIVRYGLTTYQSADGGETPARVSDLRYPGQLRDGRLRFDQHELPGDLPRW